jgi:hypothetical protein
MPATTGPFSPAQPCAFIYSGSVPAAWMHPGCIIIGGRTNIYLDSTFEQAADAGATVLIYLNPIVGLNFGNYHAIMYPSGFPQLTVDGTVLRRNTLGTTYPFADLRVQAQRDRLTSAYTQAFEDMPWLSGAFSDDIGSGSGVTTPASGGWTTNQRTAFRQNSINGGVDIRAVCDTYGKVTIHNGTWAAGTWPNGGGYPNASLHGSSLSDGWCIEHHDSEIGATPGTYFWDYYIGEPGVGAPAVQWKKPGFGIVIASATGSSGVDKWRERKNVSHITAQPDGDSYAVVGPLWGSFHPIDLDTTTGGGGGGGGGPTAVPSATTGLTVTAGNGTLNVSWNANDGAEEVDVYQVYVNDSLAAPSNLNVSGVGYTITGLTNGVSYNIRVSAHNAVGYGPWSSAVSGTPSSGAPLAPTDFGAGPPTDKTVSFTATLPTDASRTSTVLLEKATPFLDADIAGSSGVTTLATLSPGVSGDFPRNRTVGAYGTFYYRLYTQNVGGTKTRAPDISVTFTAPVTGNARKTNLPRTVAPSRRV